MNEAGTFAYRECWSGAHSTAAALASYAKQANDDELVKMATRIQLRAVRRCGELLKAIAPRDTAGPPNRKGDHTITRTQAAADAGLSEHQKRTALRVAAIPEEEFELTVESATECGSLIRTTPRRELLAFENISLFRSVRKRSELS